MKLIQQTKTVVDNKQFVQHVNMADAGIQPTDMHDLLYMCEDAKKVHNVKFEL